MNVNATWWGDILRSEDREQEVILSHLVYRYVHIDMYLPAGTIHDHVKGESAVGELEAEAVRIDLALFLTLKGEEAP